MVLDTFARNPATYTLHPSYYLRKHGERLSL